MRGTLNMGGPYKRIDVGFGLVAGLQSPVETEKLQAYMLCSSKVD